MGATEWIICHEEGYPAKYSNAATRSGAWLNFRNAIEPSANLGKFAARMRRQGYRAIRVATGKGGNGDARALSPSPKDVGGSTPPRSPRTGDKEGSTPSNGPRLDMGAAGQSDTDPENDATETPPKPSLGSGASGSRDGGERPAPTASLASEQQGAAPARPTESFDVALANATDALKGMGTGRFAKDRATPPAPMGTARLTDNGAPENAGLEPGHGVKSNDHVKITVLPVILRDDHVLRDYLLDQPFDLNSTQVTAILDAIQARLTDTRATGVGLRPAREVVDGVFAEQGYDNIAGRHDQIIEAVTAMLEADRASRGSR